MKAACQIGRKLHRIPRHGIIFPKNKFSKAGPECTLTNEVIQPNKTGKMKEKQYAKELRKLQAELCQLQEWVKYKGLRVIIVFEGRDAAGKGGTIKALTERVSPRVFRLVALPAPSDREKSQMYMQRYMQHFPAEGEVVIFDRSWYNRAGVEYVMGFCTKEQHRALSGTCPVMEKYIVARRHPAHQDLARGQRQGAEAAVRGAHGGPACASGSSARWTCPRAASGSTIPAPAT